MENVAPDLLIKDISMDGIELTERLGEAHPNVAVVVVSRHDTRRYVQVPLATGTMGYVLKHNMTETIEEAIDTVLGGMRYLCKGAQLLAGGLE